jgi:hypothetical protein
VAVLQLYLEHGVRERLRYNPVQDDGLFLLDGSVGVARRTSSGSSGTAFRCGGSCQVPESTAPLDLRRPRRNGRTTAAHGSACSP